jgi:subtilase family serine protease
MKIESYSAGSSCPEEPEFLGVRVWVTNAGPGDAGPFAVEVNGEQQRLEHGLEAEETEDLWFPGYLASEPNLAIVDPEEEVEEGNEDNNRRKEMLPLPTPVPTCTPGAVPKSSPTSVY